MGKGPISLPCGSCKLAAMNSDFESAVQRAAYEVWENDGRPQGRELEHWLLAERKVRGDNGNPPSAQNTGAQPEAAANGLGKAAGSGQPKSKTRRK